MIQRSPACAEMATCIAADSISPGALVRSRSESLYYWVSTGVHFGLIVELAEKTTGLSRCPYSLQAELSATKTLSDNSTIVPGGMSMQNVRARTCVSQWLAVVTVEVIAEVNEGLRRVRGQV